MKTYVHGCTKQRRVNNFVCLYIECSLVVYVRYRFKSIVIDLAMYVCKCARKLLLAVLLLAMHNTFTHNKLHELFVLAQHKHS